MDLQANKITVELPVKIDEHEAKFIIMAGLFGKGLVSSGKAAELLEITRLEFLERVGAYGISIFSDDEDSLVNAMNIPL